MSGVRARFSRSACYRRTGPGKNWAPSGRFILGEEPRLGSRFGANGASARRAIANNGSRVFWESEGALYLRDTTLHKTLEVASAQAHFQIAAANGSGVLFTKEGELQECKIAASGSNLACEYTDLTPVSGGESANVQGDVLGASEDDARVYFVAEGTLGSAPNTRGESAIAGQPNLYERQGASTSFIATLAGGDAHDWDEEAAAQPTRVSADGSWLSFVSERSLTGYDNKDALSGHPDAEIYLLDADTGHLSCASCNPTGARPTGVEYGQLNSANVEELISARNEWEGSGWVAALPPITTEFNPSMSSYQARFLSNSGRLFFNSLDSLVPQDVNGNWDVYESEPEGLGSCSAASASFDRSTARCTDLISSGSSAQQSAFLDASETGSDVFFITTSKLTSADIDSNDDIYDAHECTSSSPCIAAPSVPPPPCSTEASCKASPTQQPPIFGPPSSATFSGPGNPPTPAAVVVKKTAAQIKAEELTKALRSCRKRYPHSKKRRGGCEGQARLKFGPKKVSAKKSSAKKSSRKKTTAKKSARGSR
jgi:hypothetical protein